jgi:hypothetical protein
MRVMREIIHRHNQLNGSLFSTIEFGLIALLSGSFGSYYLIHHRAVMALISWGIALNCLPVVIYGMRALRDNRWSECTGSYWDRKAREKHRRETRTCTATPWR